MRNKNRELSSIFAEIRMLSEDEKRLFAQKLPEVLPVPAEKFPQALKACVEWVRLVSREAPIVGAGSTGGVLSMGGEL